MNTDPNKVAFQIEAGQAIAKNIMVPGEVGVALSTGRPQFIDALIGEIQRGARVLPPEEVAGLLCLIQEDIKERAVLWGQLDRMRHVQEAMDGFVDGFAKKVNQLEELITDTKDGKETPPFETATEKSAAYKERQKANAANQPR